MSALKIRAQLVRVLAAALLSGAGAALLLVAVVALGDVGPQVGPVHEGGWTSRSRAWFTHRGFHSTEFTNGHEGPYNWTTSSVRLEVPHLDRSRAYVMRFDLEAPRPAEAGVPQITWRVDGVPAGQYQLEGDTGVLSIRLPSSERTRAVVTMEITPTFDPGADDDRMLGVVVRTISLTPEQGGWRPTRAVVVAVAGAAALAVAGMLLCGLTGVAGVAAAALTPAAFVYLTVQDAAFLGSYSDSLFQLALAAAAIGALVRAIRATWPSTPALPHWGVAVGYVLAASVIKLAFFSHPLATIGDGVFQVHRSAMVQGGSYFFTSITPRPFFEFPYAIGLFVTAMPFWPSFPQDIDKVWLLRAIALVADGLVGIALYAVVSRLWGQQRMALLVAALWPFARAPLEALCNANLPNVFGQGLFGVAMAALLWSSAARGIGAWVGLAVSTAVLAASFLSHFSTVSVGVPLVGAVALALMPGAGREGRRQGARVLLVGMLALGVSYAVYYRHFGEVYRATADRVLSHEVAEEPGSAIAATPAVKFQRWISGTSDDYGLPGLVLALAAFAGIGLIVVQRRHDALTRALVGWLLAWAGFTALGLLTAVQMRVNLATAPVFVCLGAYALATATERGTAGRLVATVATLAIVINGASLWFMCIGR